MDELLLYIDEIFKLFPDNEKKSENKNKLKNMIKSEYEILAKEINECEIIYYLKKIYYDKCINYFKNTIDINENLLLKDIWDINIPPVQDIVYFECNKLFSIIGDDNSGNYYISIIDNENLEIPLKVKIGFISHEGYYAILANDFIEFLSIILYFPFWRDAVKCIKYDFPYSIEELEQERILDSPDYLKMQLEIAQKLNIKNNIKFNKVINNIKENQVLICGKESNDNFENLI